MTSPFPGMDPYLEGELWQEFHETLAGAVRAQLVPFLPPQYVALLAKRYVLDRSTLGIVDLPDQPAFFPDVHVVAPSEPPKTLSETRAAYTVDIAEPAEELPSPVIEELPLLHPDPDVPLDLQAAIEACFALVGYDRLFDYTLPPPPPEVSVDDSLWLDRVLTQAGLRHPGAEP